MTTEITIATFITDTIPETEAACIADTSVDYAGAKLRAIAMAKRRVYGSEMAEASITNYEIREYLANLAMAERIISFAIDFMVTHRRLSDGKQGNSITWYDLVDALDAKREQLLAWLRDHESDILELVSGSTENGREDAIDVTTLHSEFTPYKDTASVVDDPWYNAGRR